MVSDTRRAPEERGRGYNLVALMVLVAVINIGLAAALPSISQAMRREREAELVFRGLQYAEAIRVFQQRTGRYPVSLRELLHNNPRCIRQLWLDPFNDKGNWGLVLADGGAGGRQLAGGSTPGAEGDDDLQAEERARQGRRARRTGDQQQVVPTENVLDPDRREVPRSGQVVARGPIVGVRSLVNEESVRTFMGSNKYSDWLFTVDLLPTLEAPVVGENVPRLHSSWVGKAFPEGLDAGVGAGLEGEAGRNPLDRQDRRRSSSRRRSRD
jgi:type II secretory pathway pseudopilin PulG